MVSEEGASAKMGLSESDTRAKLIDPALHERQWTEDLIKREESAGSVQIIDGKPVKEKKGRIDYTLRVRVNPSTQPLAVALIEAKADHLPPNHGFEQAKAYASCKRLNVPFVIATNGHLFVEFDRFSGLTRGPLAMTELPTPTDLRMRYEHGMGFLLTDEAAQPLITPYKGGEATRRYYQDAAIRAVMERIARGEKRALLSLATGAGKTFIAVNLLRRIADAGQLRKALFLCDRDELRKQAVGAFQNAFGSDAQPVTAGDSQKNARVLIATYQTLNVDTEDADANFLLANYPEDYFSHIVIDECHRSAWGKWSIVLTHNPNAIQVGLTATPRQLKISESTPESQADAQITAEKLKYFGNPVYEYSVQQAMDDGYLAACEIIKSDILFEGKSGSEQATGLDRGDLAGKKLVDALTGIQASPDAARQHYEARSFEEKLLLPNRVNAMCTDLFQHLLDSGGPEQKSIVFCASDVHAGAVADTMNNLYATWCNLNDHPQTETYAFKCTASSFGNDSLPDLKGASRHHFIATTVELLTTGVDVPCVRNIVFFKYVKSPIAFYQMVGRGTRLDAPTGKLMFRVYDYTNATRLFGEDFVTAKTSLGKTPPGLLPPVEPTLSVEGFEVHVSQAGTYILANVDGEARPVTVEEYKELLTAKLTAEAPTLDEFRTQWIDPESRRELLENLPDGGRSALLIRQLQEMQPYDLFDVLAELGYGMEPKTRQDRVQSFTYKHKGWLDGMPQVTRIAIIALARQFVGAGTEGLENPSIFKTTDVIKAGGIAALKLLGEPSVVLHETKERLFAV
jgi:type I restriction enzyme R subunit